MEDITEIGIKSEVSFNAEPVGGLDNFEKMSGRAHVELYTPTNQLIP